MRSKLGVAATFLSLAATITLGQHISPRVVVEHVEGNASVDGERLDEPSAANFGNRGGSVVRTGEGRVIIRLSGGTLFLGENSSVRVIDRPYAMIELGVLTGSAVVITDGTGLGSAARVTCEERVTLAAAGVYRFDATRIAMSEHQDLTYCRLRVYQGAAAVQMPSFISVLTSGKMMNLNHTCGDHTPTGVFDVEEADGLDRWSRQNLGPGLIRQ